MRGGVEHMRGVRSGKTAAQRGHRHEGGSCELGVV
jgi:hypothetical protein